MHLLKNIVIYQKVFFQDWDLIYQYFEKSRICHNLWVRLLTVTDAVGFHWGYSHSPLHFLQLQALHLSFVILSENYESFPYSAEGNRSLKGFKWPHHILWEWKVLIFGKCNMCLLMTAKFKYCLPLWIPALSPLLSLKSIKCINFRTLICNLLQPSCEMSEAWIPPH